jgi:hypothetical protein
MATRKLSPKRIKNTLKELGEIASRKNGKEGLPKKDSSVYQNTCCADGNIRKDRSNHECTDTAHIKLDREVDGRDIEEVQAQVGSLVWSTTGLENMLWIVLVRYTNPRLFKAFWNRYIHPLGHQIRPAATSTRTS